MPRPFRPSAPAAPAASKAGIADLLQRGLAFHQSGRPAEAAELYRQVLRRDPRNPAANHLLGLIRLAEGHADEAVRLISRAVSVDGSDAQYLANLGVALNAADRPAEAVAALDKAIALKPDFAEAHSNRGMALRSLLRFEDAVESYQAAIRLKPNEGGFHFNLANAQEDAGLFHEAEASYAEASRLRPGHARSMAGRSRVLLSLRRHDEAVEQARLAVERLPDDVESLRALGGALRKVGRLEAALAAYDHALSLAPTNSLVHYSRATLLRHNESDPQIGVMQRLFADSSISDEDRFKIGFGLGKALDDIGAHAASVAAYRAANAMGRSRLPRDTAKQIADMQAIADDFAVEPPAWLADAGYRDSAPIFVVGLPRAGKTTVEGILHAHPTIWGAGELNRMQRLVTAVYRRNVGGLPLASFDAATVTAIGRSYSDYVRAMAPAGKTVVDTMPPNFLMIGFIRLALPNARIVHCVREPLDHCVAIFETPFTGQSYGYSYDLDELAGYYRAYRRLMAHWLSLYPDRILEVDAARLIAGDQAEILRLARFCGLEWDSDFQPELESEPQLGPEPSTPSRERRAAHLEHYRGLLQLGPDGVS